MPQSAVPSVGETMPDIPVLRTDGSAASLAALRRGPATVNYFMRTSRCPVCLAHIRRISALVAAGAIASVVVVVPGSMDEAIEAERRIADPALTVVASGDHHADLGLGRFLTLQHSGTFVVAADGRLRSVRSGALPTASFSEREVLEAVS